MKRDVLAGALLVNAIPHLVAGATGQRCLTPLGGESSSPRLNVLWSAMNVAAGVAILASAPWHGLRGEAAASRRRSAQVGIAAMSAFGQVYELVAAKR